VQSDVKVVNCVALEVVIDPDPVALTVGVVAFTAYEELADVVRFAEMETLLVIGSEWV